MLSVLSRLISFPSVKSQCSHHAPFGENIDHALRYMLSVCKKKGFQTKYADGYYGYCEYGTGKRLITILVHLDVVPAGVGWIKDSFQMRMENGKLIGRGAIDDKGPAVACVFALEKLKQYYEASNMQPKSRIRIVFGTDEECGGQDMKKYSAQEECPTYGFTADSDFPVVQAEKGILNFTLSLDANEDDIQCITGGSALNAVPGACQVKLRSEHEIQVFHGKEAHACEVAKGINAISKALSALSKQGIHSPLCDFWKEYLGSDLDGAKLGCKIQDDVSGPLTLNIGTIAVRARKFKIGIDIRFPVTYDGKCVVAMIEKRIASSGAVLEDVSFSNPLYLPTEHAVIQLLSASYREYTGDYESKAIITGGGTYARTLPNIAAFGPVFPGRQCTEHQAEEYIYLDDLYRITDIYFEAMRKMDQYKK